MILGKKARASRGTKILVTQLITNGNTTKKVNRPVYGDKRTS